MNNPLKNKMNRNEHPVGTFFAAGNAAVMEAVGRSGIDFAVIDTEHGPFDSETVQNLIRAAELTGISPLVRIANVDHREVQRAADAGADGIIAPCLFDIADFRELVRLAKYSPVGNRGFIKGRGAGFGKSAWADTKTLEEYYARSNEKLMVLPQCETKEALEQIEEIAAIPGIDGIFIGPYDLTTSIGIPGQFDHPDYLAAKARILKACKKEGKYCMIYAGTSLETVNCFREGFDAVAISLEYQVLIEAYEERLKAVREAL